MTPVVLDGSMTLAWLLPDERSAQAVAVRERVMGGGAYVPAIWATEITNAVLMAERRGRISSAQADLALESAAGLPLRMVTWEIERISTRVHRLAKQHGLTAYDACYLLLAIDEGLPLASLDGPLRRAATAAGIEVLPA